MKMSLKIRVLARDIRDPDVGKPLTPTLVCPGQKFDARHLFLQQRMARMSRDLGLGHPGIRVCTWGSLENYSLNDV